jgi:flagellar protein FlaG
MVTEVTNRLSAPVPQNAGTRTVSATSAEERQNTAVIGQDISQPGASQENASQVSATSSLEEVVSNINSYVQNINRDLQFSVDETTERVVIKVLDSETEEVIREIPSEEALALAKFLTEQQEAESTQLEGLIIQVQA